MINITFCSKEWDDSALWLKAGSWKLWIWNPVTEVSVTEYHYFMCSVQTLRLAMPSFSSNLQTILLLPEKKNSNFASFNLKSVDEIFSMETQNWTALSCGTVLIIMFHKMFFDWNPGVWPFKWKLLSYFPVVLIIVLCTVAVLFESVGEIPKCNHLHESFCEALFLGIVCRS